ncbi:MAG: asparagine--tRNA ligase [Candidatus Altiarchaeota archaeon]|nr:asparagine--tRNA ligase [Candidatus Altiarchaeota archaeon]
MYTKTAEVPKKKGKEVKLRGWVHRLRQLGDKYFVVLRDSTGIIQAVVTPDKIKGKIDTEASIELTGKVVEDKRAPRGFEVQATDLKVIGESASDWPFHRYKSTEMELDLRHLWVRSTKIQDVLRVKAKMISGFRHFLDEEDFCEVAPPIFVSAACEGGSTLFEVPYFGGKAYLSQSGQLYSESMLPALEKVYALAPSFRAEKSRTRRHVTEYWHLEPEMAWTDWKQNIDLQESLLKASITFLLDKNPELLENYQDRLTELEKWRKEKWIRIRYDEAIELLKTKLKFPKAKLGDDLGTKEEIALTDHFDTFVAVTHYPRDMKAFYMKVDEKDPKWVLSNDLMGPHVGEIIGASEREWKHDLLLENMKIHKLNPKDYAWYLDLRKYGSVPHSGFGLGIERFLMSVLKLEHIRETLPYPRFMNRTYP